MKALCSQQYENWNEKFGRLGLNCKELTGDTEIDDIFEIQNSHLIMTTPVCITSTIFDPSSKMLQNLSYACLYAFIIEHKTMKNLFSDS